MSVERRTYYRRHLPHYQPEDARYHVVFRLVGSLPWSAIERLKIERNLARQEARQRPGGMRRVLEQKIREMYFRKFDELLDGGSCGPTWLQLPSVAAIVKEAIHFRSGTLYDLLAYTIMPNHVHLVIAVGRPDWSSYTQKTGATMPKGGDRTSLTRKASEPYVLTKVLENLKWYTALQCNKVLGRTGQFWEHESYDHVIREGRLEATIRYVLKNPVSAGLVPRELEWQWSFCRPGILDTSV
ncbi:MAG: hypothetical protein HBSIN02_17930 [Bacteroidia bacterium]|nr:MAG: hypothetical protein HBSIN02_17930 [Bacteroidia bacterium]